MVRVTKTGHGELECTVANVIKGFIVKNHTLVFILNKLVNRECGAVHGAWLQIHEHYPGYEPPIIRLVIVQIDSLQLQLCAALVALGGVDVMLSTDHIPELGFYLILTLPTLSMKDFTHFFRERVWVLE